MDYTNKSKSDDVVRLNEQDRNIVLFSTEDEQVAVDVLFMDETVWLTIDQMSILFGKSRSTINEHILHIFEEGELVEDASVRKIGISVFSTS